MNMILTYLELLPQHVGPVVRAFSSRRALRQGVKDLVAEIEVRKKALDAKCAREWKEMNKPILSGMGGFPNTGANSEKPDSR